MANNLVDHIGNNVTLWHTTGNSMSFRTLVTVDEFGVTVKGGQNNATNVFVPWGKINYIDLVNNDKKIGYSSTLPQT